MRSSLVYADFVLGLQHGDEGKGKVVHHLCRTGEYNLVLRGQGGPNAGHTIYHDGVKYVTHLVPAGVFFGIRSVIGPGCVIDITKLFAECGMLSDAGIDIKSLLRIDRRAHVITGKHRDIDSHDCEVNGIGTTKCGIGPAYSDKYSRDGVQLGQLISDYYNEPADNEHDGSLLPYFAPLLTDIFDELHTAEHDVTALYEGAQGHELDIDWGDFPYVTSSHTTLAGALLNGIMPSAVRRVYGVAKAYETYVGAKKFHNDCKLAHDIQEAGAEYGATTGRLRQVDFLHIPRLMRACLINDITHLIVNKCDVLEKVCNSGIGHPYYLGEMMARPHSMASWREQITALMTRDGLVENVIFSGSPERI